MSDFFTRLAAAASALDGVRRITIQHGGRRGTANRYRHHPHMLITLSNDRVIQYPLRGRPSDASRGYFCSIVHGIRRRVEDALGTRGQPRDERIQVKVPVRARHRRTTRSKKRPERCEPPTWTRLSANPFEKLTSLMIRPVPGIAAISTTSPSKPR
jgi:hypothetical protein